MARILWHGIGPWHKTGYGVQTALFAPRLAALGHQVVIAAMGRKGVDDDPRSAHPDALDTLRTGTWHGLPVIGPGYSEFGLPAPLEIRGPFGGHDPDLIIVLKDPWVLQQCYGNCRDLHHAPTLRAREGTFRKSLAGRSARCGPERF